MIQAQRINGLGLVLNTYNEFMTPMRSAPLAGGLGYYTVDDNPLQGVSPATGIAIALGGLALGVGSGVVLWKRRKVAKTIKGVFGFGRTKRQRRRRR